MGEGTHVNSIPERLHAILDILTKHQKDTITSMTEASDNPSEVNRVKQLLERHFSILIMFIDSDGEYIDPAADNSIKACIEQLKMYIYPPDNRVSVYTKQWAEDIKNNVFTLSPKHIQVLKKSVEDLEDES